MTKIGLLSDTHGWLHPNAMDYLNQCHEIWHAGDFGSMDIIASLEKIKPLRGVWGNIDAPAIRHRFSEDLFFTCEGVHVYMRHIGGYPGKYAPGVKNKIQQHGSGLFISGHSHILKIQYDEQLQCLLINPGALGNQGWHQLRTMVLFTIHQNNISDCQIIELGKRGAAVASI